MTGRKTTIDGKSSIENEKKNKLAKDKFIEKVAVKEQKLSVQPQTTQECDTEESDQPVRVKKEYQQILEKSKLA